MRKILILFIALFLCGCELDIPDGKGMCVIENKEKDLYKIVRVDYSLDRRDWTTCWTEGQSNKSLNSPYIYLEPGEYYFFVLSYFYGFRNPVYTDYKVVIREDEATYMSFWGNRLEVTD